MKLTKQPGVLTAGAVALTAASFGLGSLFTGDSLAQLSESASVATEASPADIQNAKSLSRAFRDVSKSMRPSVVSISSVKNVQLTRGARPQVPEELRRFFGDDMLDRFGSPDGLPDSQPRSRQQQGLGSGVIVSEDGFILTNNHVVEGADEVTVQLYDDRQLTAKIVGTDAKTDLAVLKIEASGLVPARLGNSAQMEVGDWVLAMGSPFGLNQTVTAGIVSATGRANVGIVDYEDFIQTDAAINPGNSGGPLVNLLGEVVGINTAIASRSGGNTGVGFAIPSNMVRRIMDDIRDDGLVQRGWLGAVIQNLNADLAKSFNYDSTDGVLLGDVVANGPAAKSGLQAGDIVVGIGGKNILDVNQLRNMVAAIKPNTSTEFEIVRNGQRRSIEVTIGLMDNQAVAAARGAAPGPAVERSIDTEFGATVQDVTADLAQQLNAEGIEGAVVTKIEAGSSAAQAGLRTRDIVVAVGSEKIASAEDFRAAIEKVDLSEGVRLQVVTDGVRRFLIIRTN
jgi:serine protease Do